MLILGIDTAGRAGSVALVRVTDANFETIGIETLEGRRYSEQLLPSVVALLERHSLPANAIALIGASSGPGSFTGIRVALATAKGLAEAWRIPVIGVSGLEAVARQAATDGAVTAVVDALRGELFCGTYQIAGTTATRPSGEREIVTPLEKFVAAQREKKSAPLLMTPDEKLQARLAEANVAAQLTPWPTAADFARIAWYKQQQGIHEDLAELDANYVRRSDAEIFSAPKLGLKPQ